MAYRAINDSELKVDSPVDTALVTALRDNCIAIPQALSGAPKVALSALADSKGGVQSSGSWTLRPDFGRPDFIHDMHFVQQLRVYDASIPATTAALNNYDGILTSQGYTIKTSGTYSMAIMGNWTNCVPNNFISRILVDDVIVFSQTSTTTSTSGGDADSAISVIYDVELAAGDVVKLQMVGKASKLVKAISVGGVILNICSDNYMGETVNMAKWTSVTGVYANNDPTVVNVEAIATPKNIIGLTFE